MRDGTASDITLKVNQADRGRVVKEKIAAICGRVEIIMSGVLERMVQRNADSEALGELLGRICFTTALHLSI